MMRKIRKYVFPLAKGWGGLAATSHGLVALVPVRSTQAEAEAELARALPAGTEDVPQLADGLFGEEDLVRIAEELNRYYQGEKVALDYPVDWKTTGVTEFQQKALEACKAVPYGSWASYGDLAKAVGNAKASRAIGGAMHINPVSLVVP